MLTPLSRLTNLLQHKPIDRPPFFPALYDFKARLAGVPPHLFGQSPGELESALSAEADDLDAEILTSAYDIYNIEAEALGARVDRSPGIPMPEIRTPLITSLDEVERLPRLKAPTGRMTLFIEAARKINARYGARIPVRGAVSGPFSMAATLYPREQLLMDAVMSPERVRNLLAFCTAVIKIYIEGYLTVGTGVVVFDSFIAPPMLSPQLYEELVLPFHQDIFSLLGARGVGHRPLIAGGNTLPLLPYLAKTGANQLLLDYSIPPEQAKEILIGYKDLVFRVNLPPLLLSRGSATEIEAHTQNLLAQMRNTPNFILGTSILSQDTPPDSIRTVKETLIRFYS
jgi:uroporphyrinogen decarboxylase